MNRFKIHTFSPVLSTEALKTGENVWIRNTTFRLQNA